MDKFSTTARIIIFILTLTNGVLTRPRMSRQSSSFMVISNYSAPCETFSTTLPRVALTDQDKMDLFHSLGGYIVPTLMAVDKEQAVESFNNLIPLPKEIKADIEDFTSNKAKSLLKQSLTDYLKHQKEQLKPKNLDVEHQDRAETRTENTAPNADRNAMLNKVPEKLGHELEARRIRHVREAKEMHDVTNDHENKEVDEKTHKDKDSTDTSDQKDKVEHKKKDSSKMEATDEEQEIILPVEDTLIPPVQRSTKGTSYLENCFLRKSPSPMDNVYLTMCSACTATTDLDEDMFPRIINEVTCIQGDNNCLFVEGIAHGKCQQVEMPFNGLRKREGRCVLALKNGDTVVADEWDVETLMIRVGCECTVHRDSFFVQFL